MPFDLMHKMIRVQLLPGVSAASLSIIECSSDRYGHKSHTRRRPVPGTQILPRAVKLISCLWLVKNSYCHQPGCLISNCLITLCLGTVHKHHMLAFTECQLPAHEDQQNIFKYIFFLEKKIVENHAIW